MELFDDVLLHSGYRPSIERGKPKPKGKIPMGSFDEEDREQRLKAVVKRKVDVDMRAQQIWNDFAVSLYDYFVEKGYIGQYTVNTQFAKMVDGDDITMTTKGLIDQQTGRPMPFKAMRIDPKNQLFYAGKPTNNCSLEVSSSLRNKVIYETGWFLDSEKKTDLYAMQFVRVLSPRLLELVEKRLEDCTYKDDAGRNSLKAMFIEKEILLKDILVMEIYLVDRWRIYEELKKFGYDSKKMYKVANIVRGNKAMHDTYVALPPLDSQKIAVYYTTDKNPNNSLKERPVNIILQLNDKDPWVRGHYILTADEETGARNISGIKPFNPEWGSVPVRQREIK